MLSMKDSVERQRFDLKTWEKSLKINEKVIKNERRFQHDKE